MADLGAIGRMPRLVGVRPFPVNRGLGTSVLATISAVDVAHTISGTVQNAAGAFLAGVRVNLCVDDGGYDLVATTVTNSAGTYSFPFLDNTITYAVWARDPTNTYNIARADRIVPV